jgi:hypothetical protein
MGRTSPAWATSSRLKVSSAVRASACKSGFPGAFLAAAFFAGAFFFGAFFFGAFFLAVGFSAAVFPADVFFDAAFFGRGREAGFSAGTRPGEAAAVAGGGDAFSFPKADGGTGSFAALDEGDTAMAPEYVRAAGL